MVKKLMWKSTGLDWFLRLCRLMCGRSETFRKLPLIFGAMPHSRGRGPWGFEAHRWGKPATAHQVAKPPKPVTSGNLLLVAFTLALLTACQAASSRQPAPPEPVPAGTLTREYQESTTDARRRYDGKEITVKGLTVMTAMMPPSASEEGLILLEERGASLPRRVSCWFSKDQTEQFSKIKSGEYITVRGIFNGESGVELKFCKLVTIE